MALIGTWTPGYAIHRNPYEWGAFSLDLQRFARLVRGTTVPPPARIITNPSAQDVFDLVASSPYIAVDIETAPETDETPWTGKDPTRATLKTIGLGTADAGLSHRWCGNGCPVERAIRQVLADRAITKVFHNGPWFDLRVLARFQFPVNNWEDTRDLRRALSATSPLKLLYLGSIYTDFEPWKEGDSDDDKGLVFTKDWEQLKRYNALDCVVTSRVWEGMQPEAKDARIQRLYALHKKLAVIAAKMHTTGFYVDTLQRGFMAYCLEQQYQEQVAELLAFVNMPGFVCSANALRSLIYKRHETAEIHRFSLPDPIDPAMWTEKGKIAVDKDGLLLLYIDPACPQELRQIIDLYWAAQTTQKQLSTFVMSPAITQAIGQDGRLRAGWNSCGTDTGRFSGSEPNLMNVKQYLRAMYRAAPGHVLIGADYSQLELRVMAAVAPDEELQRRLDLGDVYTADAVDWFKLPPETTKKTVKSSVRKLAKGVHLGSQYGAGAQTVWQQMLKEDRSTKFSHVALLHEAFKRTYKQTVDYWFREEKCVIRQGYSEDRIHKRRRTYPRQPPLTEVANYPIQATAAAIANEAIVAMDERLPGDCKLIVQLHDAFYVEAPEGKEDEALAVVGEAMERPHVINGREYRFPIEAKTAVYWDEL